ncbi:DUF551 domain-containing protein [Escherichia coli O21,81:H5,27]
MNTVTKEQLIEELKASTQNASGMFEISEETICALMSMLIATPSPVVPDEMTPKQASRSYCGEVRGYRDGWNACRAAMLQGKSEQPQNAQQNIPENIPGGNSPVTPDGWISCSERMPDSKTAVLVAREFDRKGDWRMKWATYIPGHPDANDGWLIPGASWKPSHWMPLPEPPQEVNRG